MSSSLSKFITNDIENKILQIGNGCEGNTDNAIEIGSESPAFYEAIIDSAQITASYLFSVKILFGDPIVPIPPSTLQLSILDSNESLLFKITSMVSMGYTDFRKNAKVYSFQIFDLEPYLNSTGTIFRFAFGSGTYQEEETYVECDMPITYEDSKYSLKANWQPPIGIIKFPGTKNSFSIKWDGSTSLNTPVESNTYPIYKYSGSSIDTSTSYGTWYYKKWKDGTAECWGIIDSRSYAMTSGPSGTSGWYYTSLNDLAFPPGLFNTITSAVSDRSGGSGSSGGNGLIATDVRMCTPEKISFFIWNPSSSTYNVGVSLDVKGTWATLTPIENKEKETGGIGSSATIIGALYDYNSADEISLSPRTATDKVSVSDNKTIYHGSNVFWKSGSTTQLGKFKCFPTGNTFYDYCNEDTPSCIRVKTSGVYTVSGTVYIRTASQISYIGLSFIFKDDSGNRYEVSPFNGQIGTTVLSSSNAYTADMAIVAPNVSKNTASIIKTCVLPAGCEIRLVGNVDASSGSATVYPYRYQSLQVTKVSDINL